MSELRSLPLKTLAAKSNFVNAKANSGVTLSIVHPVSLVTVIARKAKAKAVRDTLGKMRGLQVMEAGADQWFVQGQDANTIKTKLGTSASVIDQSHGRVVLRVSGPKVRAVLAKGTPVDLHKDHFPIGKSAMTTMAHVGVHLTRSAEDEFTLSVFRGFSEHFWEWLTMAAAEYGCEISG
jgi:methylglutamate dehydrogenase subunit D